MEKALEDASQALQESEEKYRQLVEHLPLGIAIFQDDSIAFANTALAGFTGRRPDELEKMPARELIEMVLPEHRGYVERFIGQVRAEGVLNEPLQFRIAGAPDGTVRWLEAHVVPIFYRGRGAFQVSLVDITENKEFRRLRHSKDFIHGVLDAIEDPLIIKNHLLRYVMVNEAACALLARDRDDLIGRCDYDFFPWEQAEGFNEEDKAVLDSGVPKVSEVKLSSSGKPLTFITRKFLFSDPDTGRKFLVNSLGDITDLKELLNALQRSRKQLLAVTRHARAWMWEVDADGLYTYASPAAEDILGYAPEDIVGKKHFYDLFHQADREELKGLALAAFADRDPIRDFVNRNVHREGNEVWLSTSGIPVLDERGDLKGYRGTDIDVTAFMIAERALRDNETRYRELFDRMSTSVAVYQAVGDGQDFVFVDFNRAGEVIDDVSRDDLIGRRVTEAFPAVKEFGLLEVFRRVFKSGEPEDFPIAFYQDERVAGWRENHVYRLPTGEVVAVYSDKTAQKQAEDRLRESEARFRTIVDYSPNIELFRDKNGNLTYVNNAFERMLGYPPGDYLAGTVGFDDIVHPDDRPQAREVFRKALRGQVTKDFRMRMVRADGRTVQVTVSVQPVTMEDGEFAGFRTSITEILER